MVLEGEGSNGNLGQDMTPEATGQSFTLTGYKRSVDLAGRRARTEQTRTPTFVYFQGQSPQKQVQGSTARSATTSRPTATRRARRMPWREIAGSSSIIIR